jgi:hypothetical protein
LKIASPAAILEKFLKLKIVRFIQLSACALLALSFMQQAFLLLTVIIYG